LLQSVGHLGTFCSKIILPAELSIYGNVTLLDAEFTAGPNKGMTPTYAPDYQIKTGRIYRYKTSSVLSGRPKRESNFLIPTLERS
jgi:hypothetical protein